MDDAQLIELANGGDVLASMRNKVSHGGGSHWRGVALSTDGGT